MCEIRVCEYNMLQEVAFLRKHLNLPASVAFNIEHDAQVPYISAQPSPALEAPVTPDYVTPDTKMMEQEKIVQGPLPKVSEATTTISTPTSHTPIPVPIIPPSPAATPTLTVLPPAPPTITPQPAPIQAAIPTFVAPTTSIAVPAIAPPIAPVAAPIPVPMDKDYTIKREPYRPVLPYYIDDTLSIVSETIPKAKEAKKPHVIDLDAPSPISSTAAMGDDDVVIVAERTVSLPHSRYHCTKFKYTFPTAGVNDVPAGNNALYCEVR